MAAQAEQITMKKLLENINSPQDLRRLRQEELPLLAGEIRDMIIDVVSKNGGHLASSLGAVEIAIALHYVLNTPRDKIVWDVGHQAYAHKILTGRKNGFRTLRQLGGISGFPNKGESPHDVFTVGHSSTSISCALGLACARDLKGGDEKIAAVTGDAALASGMAFEAMNQAGHMQKDMIVILNDNEQSISQTVGGLSNYLNTIITNPTYNRIHGELERFVKGIPRIGFRAHRAARRFEEGLKNLLVPGILFEELGFRYFGPIDGHDTNILIQRLKDLMAIKGPILLHVITKKGKGYPFAEENPVAFHGSHPFDVNTGKVSDANGAKGETYSDAFGKKIVELAARFDDIVVVSAAMLEGTGLVEFAGRFPERTFDVGIAEGHAVTFSGAMASGGTRPFCVVYSTFLQRGYDQIIQDVCLQNAPVVFCLDRAGLVGEDGPTHHGVFDIAYMRHIPNLVVAAPKDTEELKAMLALAYGAKRPFSIRYPRGAGPACAAEKKSTAALEVGRAEILKDGKHAAILALGSMAAVSLAAAKILQKEGIDVAVVNARFIKPLDKEMISDLARRCRRLVTVEEGIANGGFGSAVLEFIDRENIEGARVKVIGLPDEFIEHGRREELLIKYHLNSEGIASFISRELFDKELNLTSH